MKPTVNSAWLDAESRSMSSSFNKIEFYRSQFNPQLGQLARIVPKKSDHGDSQRYMSGNHPLHTVLCSNGEHWDTDLSAVWKKKYGHRCESFSPVPETVDVQLTNWCDYGCSYCYQSSTKKDAHCRPELVEDIIKGFDQPPYQIAYGGGEPTSHPEFCNILKRTAELGVVPNYTTAGHMLTDDILYATKKFCGGVALTYHAWAGITKFKTALRKLEEALVPQINIHIIADDDVVTSLKAVRGFLDKDYPYWQQCGSFNIVLLAYYPQGRGTLSRVMCKHTYNVKLPGLLAEWKEEEYHVAFSEGLLPFFLSRPWITDIRFATRSEGLFSCYVDRTGKVSKSSFDVPRNGEWTFYHEKTQGIQHIWNQGLNSWGDASPHMQACDNCAMKDRCAVPDKHHYFACAYANHNK